MTKALSSYAPGSIIKLYEDGVLAEFYVSKHNYEPELNGDGRTLLVRRYAPYSGNWNNDAEKQVNYETSDIDAHYSTTYLDKLDNRLRSVLGYTMIRCETDGVPEFVVARRVFGLSRTELGCSASNTVKGDGTALPIASVLKIATKEDGTEVDQMTRTYSTSNTVITVSSDGSVTSDTVNAGCFYRPAFTVPETLNVTDDDILLGREKAITLREAKCGDIVSLTEHGVQNDYVVSQHDYESELNGEGRTLLVRRDLYDTVKCSEIDASLTTWMEGLEDEVRSLIEPVKILSNKRTAVNTEEKDVFIPSWYELAGNLESEDFQLADGTLLPVAPILRAPFYNGIQTSMWTRSMDSVLRPWNLYIAAGTQPAYYIKGVAPTFTLPDTLYITIDGRLTTAAVPEISGNFTTGTNIGVQNAAVDIEYTAKGNDGDVITVKEYLDGTCKSAYTVESGLTNVVKCLAGENYQTVLNGDHTLEVVAYNGEAESERFVITFTKKVTEATVSFEVPVDADDQITLAVASLVGSIPSDAEVSLLVTNNAKDAEPVWEDATSSLRDGYNHIFTNTLATNGFAFNFRFTVRRGASDIGGYISSIGGAIQ